MTLAKFLHAEVEEVRPAAGAIRIAGAVGGAAADQAGAWRLRLTSRERARSPFVRRIMRPSRTAHRDYEVAVDGLRFEAEIRIADFALGHALPCEHWDAYLTGPDDSLPLARRPGTAAESFPAQTTAGDEPIAIRPVFTDHGTLLIRCQRLPVPPPYDRPFLEPY